MPTGYSGMNRVYLNQYDSPNQRIQYISLTVFPMIFHGKTVVICVFCVLAIQADHCYF